MSTTTAKSSIRIPILTKSELHEPLLAPNTFANLAWEIRSSNGLVPRACRNNNIQRDRNWVC